MANNSELNLTSASTMSDSNQVIPLDLVSMKKELFVKMQECQQRGLTQTYKWLAELGEAMRGDYQIDLRELMTSSNSLIPQDMKEFDTYMRAKSYFDLKEYDRCAHFTAWKETPRLRFLNFYSRYMSGEKKRLDDLTDSVMAMDKEQMTHLTRLREEMDRLDTQNALDGYCLYLYGVVLKKLSLNELARNVLVRAIKLEPCHWGAWLELSGHITDKNEIQNLDLPDHWIKHFFLAHTYLELQMNDVALDIYFGLKNGGLKHSTYILAQVAIVFHNLREVDQAVEFFHQLLDADPCRLDNLDTFSNLLYVKEERVDLAYLARKTSKIDKYRTETCCVIGNYYSLRSQHEKAVTYFQRALKLNPNYLSAWTLMGHEFIELKNTNAAIQSYRHAIEVNKRDYRAWYGLGQTYEMLKMHFYCLYYYKKAQELRPDDSRMLVALGETYDKLDKTQEAMKCFWKAHCVGDVEGGIALFQLAKLYEKVNDEDQAAAAYHQYILDSERQGITDRDQQSRAYKFLAQYFLKKGQLEDAYDYGQKCTEFADTREDGKAILKDIANRRAKLNSSSKSKSEEQIMEMTANAEGTFTEPGLLGAAQIGIDESVTGLENTRTELEPMNLTFTP